MFDIEQFYAAAFSGQRCDVQGLAEHVRSFEHVVFWGAGNLGTSLGRKFLQLNLPITAYWDVRAQQIRELHGIQVLEPFEGGFDRSRTLVVFCITNVFVAQIVARQLRENGHDNLLIGHDLYQGLICPVTRESFDISVCRDMPACNVCSCTRLDNIVRAANTKDGSDNLHFPNITFVINQKCTLSCKYCYSYTNNYPKEKRVNFPLERVTRDIDRFFDAVDSVTLVPVVGGEPFLHPDLGVIVKKFLEKTNLGVLNVTTNGICKISPRQLEGLQDDRARVFFSNYLDCLTPAQGDLFHRNIELVQSQGVVAIAYNTTPQWTVPVTLDDKGFSTARTTAMKANCMLTPYNGKYVKNGRFYPCTIADSVHNLGIADYPTDYVVIDSTRSDNELRQRIRDVMEAPFHQACRHCGDREKVTARAGVQGFTDYAGRERSPSRGVSDV